MNEVFLEITVNADAIVSDVSAEIARLCPVDIFTVTENRLVVRAENVDECTLCELCLRAVPASAPAGAITIRKRYSDEVLVSGQST